MAKVEVEVDDDLLARAEELGVDVRQALALGLRGEIRTAEVVRDLDGAFAGDIKDDSNDDA